MINKEVSMTVRCTYRVFIARIAILVLGALLLGIASPERVFGAAAAVIFCNGDMGYPTGLTTSEISGYRSSGFETMILFSMSVEANGDFDYGGAPIVQNGVYDGPSNWGSLISQCRAAPSTVNRIEMCIGGWGDPSFQNIENRIASDGTGSGTVLYRNLQALKSALGINAIDYDDEQTYDSGSAVNFGLMVGATGMYVTLCPYTNPGYWQSVKSGLGATADAVYLQCYDGGAGNDPGAWNTYFGGLKVIPGYWDYERDTTFLTKMQGWQTEGVVGGFLWPSNSGGTPPADGAEMLQYAGWIHTSLDTNTPANYNWLCNENDTIFFSAPADAAYGASGSYFYKYAQEGSFTFTNTTFGGDPAYGAYKTGYYNPYTECASEGGSAVFTLPVEAAYGANGSYYFNSGISGTVTFSNTAWGGDPAPDIVKAGYYMPYTQCAAENGSYTFTVPCDIAYGANGSYIFRHAVTGTITFNNGTFTDPDPGVVKAGYFHPSH